MKGKKDNIGNGFYYPDAGLKAPAGVKREIKKFRQMPETRYKVKRPLLFHLLGSGTQPYKMTKRDSDYTDESIVTGETCGNCKSSYLQVATGRILCSQIRGRIKLEGWCRLFQLPKMKT